MNQDSSASEGTLGLWNDNIWDRLLDSLNERSVIPIVGPDLVQVEVDGAEMLLSEYVARRLAEANRLPLDDLPSEWSLNHIVCQLLRLRKDRYAICDDIFQIMKDATFRPSRALRQLAEITDFNLFVSTTFDSLLEKAINEARFGKTMGTTSVVYSPRKVDDLPAAKDRLPNPTVYYLMGKLSAKGSYVISDEDLLEYVCDLQSPTRRPEMLFDELKKNHLLILGEDFSDWIVRIFLRTTRGRLSASRDFVEILADSKTHRDSNLVSFLLHFSSHTKVFRAGGATEFVNELWERWRQRNPRAPVADGEPASQSPARNPIFISYAREDVAAALEIKAGLESSGLAVWLDQDRLKPGDSFNPHIENYISKLCSCFIAVISKNTEQRQEGFFRREWNLAVERDKGIHFERKFIVPVVVDDITEPARVPLRFSQLHYTWLPGGTVTDSFVQEMKSTVARS